MFALYEMPTQRVWGDANRQLEAVGRRQEVESKKKIGPSAWGEHRTGREGGLLKPEFFFPAYIFRR